ncbi:MAG: extensin family protein [Xanthobacteraceae bacterium]|jgi:hypothetical protein
MAGAMAMRAGVAAALAVAACGGFAWAEPVPRSDVPAITGRIPLPEARPPIELRLKYGPRAIFVPDDHLVNEPSRCLVEVQKVAVVESIALVTGPDMCGSPDMVRLKAVRMPDGREVEIAPAAELRCTMAVSLAAWLRDELPGAIGSEIKKVVAYNSYECRPRNRVFGANVKVSEHGKGNALDIRAFVRADGSTIDPTSIKESRPLREAIRKSACERFATVLGPGSDGYHEEHIHVDAAERHNNYKICHWVVKEPKPVVAAVTPNTSAPAATAPAAVPLPPPKPAIPEHSGKRLRRR